MAQSIRIGRLFGIDIELHWTLIILLLITLFLGGYVFLLMVLLFACVLVHELTHSITSQRNGIKVRKIILQILGGASIIDEVKIRPDVEFRIAVSGPLMSLFLGSVFGALVALSPPGLLNQVLQFLFEINIILGALNLLPALPLDGGRVFRSYLERKNSEYRATILTVRASMYVMALLIVGTLVYLSFISAPFVYKEFVFIWIMLLVFFMYGGATAEREMAEIKRNARGVDIRDAVSKRFKFVDPNRSVSDLYDVVKSSKEHVLITRIGNDYAYVNLLRRVKLNGAKRAMDVATRIPSLTARTNIVDALQVMEAGESGIAAIVSKDRLVGIVTMSHLQTFLSLRVLKRRKRKEI